MERQRRIDEIEAKATESELIGRSATDPEVRTYNLRLAEELRAYVEQLRRPSLSDVVAGNARQAFAEVLCDGKLQEEGVRQARDGDAGATPSPVKPPREQ